MTYPKLGSLFLCVIYHCRKFVLFGMFTKVLCHLWIEQERYEAQLRTLTILVKHRIEHFCQLYGLEMSMFALLLSSFALLNVFSLFYIFILALCIMLPRRTLRMLWPFFVVLFAIIMVTEYAILGRAPPPWTVPSVLTRGPRLQCVECWSSYTSHNSFCWQCWLGTFCSSTLLKGSLLIRVFGSPFYSC